MRQKPTVLSREIVASSRLFRVEAVELRFSNGVERTYERLVGRELKEEAGFGARQLEHLTELSLSPGYMSQKIQVVLATDLYEERLEGDEPEPMGVDKVNLRELSALAMHPQFSEGRALAALYLARDLLIQRGVLAL